MSNSTTNKNFSSETLPKSSCSGEIQREDQDGFRTETDEDVTQNVILSVIFQGHKIGAAYYDVDRCHLCLMADHIDPAPSYSVLKLLVKQSEPSVIITSSRTDESILTVLKEISNSCRTNESVGTSISFPLKSEALCLLPGTDFALEACRHRLQNLELSNTPRNMSTFEKYIHSSSFVDCSSICMIKAAGGLLKYIENSSIGGSLLFSNTVNSISTLSLKKILNLDENSYRALQIFQEERHPSVYKNTSGIKEGLSLYGICNKCKSTIGKKELKRWFLLPSNDPVIIQERQAAVKYFSSLKNADVVSALQSSLKHIKFLPRILARMKTAQASMTDWQSLYKTAYHAMMIGDICRSRANCLKIFEEISQTFSTDLFRISSLLNKIIDFDEYAKQNHFVVKPGVDSELDKMKRTYNGLPDFMTQVAYQELQDLGHDIEQCSVIYLPQLGYLLAIPITEQMKETKDYNIPNLRFMFIVNDIVHYKSENTRKLDSLLGDTLCDIYDKETQIMHKLQNVVLEMKVVLFDVMEYAAKLDCLISFAVTAKEYSWIQPIIATNKEIEVIKGRHPLLEMCVASYVANDIYSGASDNKIKVITGPNSSGKSMYLQEVALIVFMTHLGSFVPAQSAKIPMLDNIFTCMHVTESVSFSLSSFLLSMNQISSILTNANQTSLIIVDEFGQHTDADSGLSLLASCLEFWIQKQSECPHVFVATHFLWLNKILPQSPLIKFQTLDIIENEDLVFLYQLVDGIAPASFASHTALTAGLSEEVIRRSLAVSEMMCKNQAIVPDESSSVFRKMSRYESIYDEFLKLDIPADCLSRFLEFVKETNETPLLTPLTSSASRSNHNEDTL